MLGEKNYSVGVFRSSVLCSSLAVVTRLAKRLPVRVAPHQDTITSMRNDVVNDCRRHEPAVSHALHTYWILAEVCLAHSLPLTAVSTLCGGWPVGVQGLMLCTVLFLRKARTAGMAARSFGFTGHGSPPAIKKALAGFLPQRLVVFSVIIYSITSFRKSHPRFYLQCFFSFP